MDDELRIKGMRRLEWAETHMKVLNEIGGRLVRDKAFEGAKVGMALHVEAKTGMLAVWLARAGAEVRLASCNPLSTDDSVALSLKEDYGIKVYAKKWENKEEYYGNRA
ncbi:MAG: adenosylhomocysteinase, partial [Methanomassiliicoccales archaeon]